jgi:arsenate reductase-like glutaredoxin family protein
MFLNKVKEALAGISDILYHATQIPNATNILKENKFTLTFVSGADDAQKPQTKYYYLSTTRSKLGSYHAGTRIGTILVLDGRKLSHNYVGNPVDYWGREFRKVAPSKNEMEDRIWSDKPFIKPAAKYIKEIHILFLIESYDNEDVEKGWLKTLLLEAYKHNIPAFVYTDKKAAATLNKAKATPIDDLGLSAVQEREDKRGHRDDMGVWLELYKKNDQEELSTEPFGGAKRTLNTLFSFDGYKSFEADIHNSKRNAPSLHEIVEILKQKKWNMKDFYKHLQDKWKGK